MDVALFTLLHNARRAERSFTRAENVSTTPPWFDLDARRRPFEEPSPAILFDEFIEEALDLFDRDEKRRLR